MKKLLAITLMLLTLLTVFSACGNNDSKEKANIIGTDASDVLSVTALKQNKTNKNIGEWI